MPSTDTVPMHHTSPTLQCPKGCRASPSIIHDFATNQLECGTCHTPITDSLPTTQPWSPTLKQQQLQDALLLMDVATSNNSDSGDSTVTEDTPVVPSRASLQRYERNLTRAFTSIRQLSQTMDLPTQITQTACNLYQQASASSLQRGKSTDAVVATCIFLACRQEGAPRTFKEICALTRVPRKDIGRTFKLLKDKLGADAKGMEAGALLARFCANLSLLEGAKECAVRLSRRAKECDTLAGKSPVSVAGACIYMASHLVAQPRDATVISHVAGVSEVTIKNAYRLLFADRKRLLSADLLALVPHASIDYLPLP